MGRCKHAAMAFEEEHGDQAMELYGAFLQEMIRLQVQNSTFEDGVTYVAHQMKTSEMLVRYAMEVRLSLY
jgi:hypothetical protein